MIFHVGQVSQLNDSILLKYIIEGVGKISVADPRAKLFLGANPRVIGLKVH